jgi:hypothetical protein
MPRYLYLYRGPAPLVDPTPEETAERTAAFGAWITRVGRALVDVGAPFGSGCAVRDDGAVSVPPSTVGYSIVEAADLDQARALTAGLPFLSQRDGSCTVEIFELLDG